MPNQYLPPKWPHLTPGAPPGPQTAQLYLMELVASSLCLPSSLLPTHEFSHQVLQISWIPVAAALFI